MVAATAATVMLGIERLRDDLRAASGRWTVGVNAFTTMSLVERLRYLSYQPTRDELSLKRRDAVSRLSRSHEDSVPPLRSSSDLRSRGSRNFVSSLGDRTVDGIAKTVFCVIETTARVARDIATLEIERPPLVRDRELSLGRAWLRQPYSTLILAVGIPDGRQREPQRPVTVRRWHELHTRSAMKQWLSTQGPLLAVLAVHEDFFAYASGVYHYISGPLEGGHCVAVLGYDDSGGYWIAQNTWGHGWGERGCFRIAFGERGIDASMWGVELD